MEKHNEPASDDNVAIENETIFFNEDIVAYTRTLEVLEDYVVLSSVKKPSLSEYDDANVVDES